MKKMFLIAVFLFMSNVYAGLIEKPVLMPKAGKAAACLEKLVRNHISMPGENARITKWIGPGVRYTPEGVDSNTAAYAFTVSPSEKTYAILLSTTDDKGFEMFYFKEEGKLQIGFKAAHMESTGELFEAQIRGLGEVETTPIDLTPCASLFIK